MKKKLNEKLTDYEMFDCELAALRHRISSLSVSVCAGLHDSRLWSYHQRHRQQVLLEFLGQFLHETQKWEFFRDLSQSELDFESK